MGLPTGDEGGGGRGWRAGAYGDRGEAENAAVDEAAAGVFVDEELVDELRRAVRALRRGDCFKGHCFGLSIGGSGL